MDEVTGLDFTFQLAVLYNVNEKLFATYYSNGHIFIWIQRLQYSYSAWLLHFFSLSTEKSKYCHSYLFLYREMEIGLSHLKMVKYA